MEKNKIDYLIVGLGIAGSWLAYHLMKHNHQIVVINETKGDISSIKAAGLYNPITGRKMVKTWMADQIFPELERKYEELEKFLSASFLRKTPIYRPFKSIAEKNDWEGKMSDPLFNRYVKQLYQRPRTDDLGDEYGGLFLNFSGWVDIPSLIIAMKRHLMRHRLYREEVFDYQLLEVDKASTIHYGDIEAKKIIFCEGAMSTNPFWSSLPFRPVRGEIIDVKLDFFDPEYVYNHHLFMIPKEGYYTIGSTYDHRVLTFEPQKSGIQSLLEKLSLFYKGSIKILDERAGVRPATHDRRPYIGSHKSKPNVDIFNGFGTKGVSLAPFFSDHYVAVLEGKQKIDKDADVQRIP